MSGVRTVHPEASTIVRRIFDEALAGKKPGDIARGLNEDGVLTPGLYFRKKYPDNGRFGNISEKQTWNYYKVHVILRRLVYTGAAVGGLRKQLMPCKKVTTKVDREEWVVVPDMGGCVLKYFPEGFNAYEFEEQEMNRIIACAFSLASVQNMVKTVVKERPSEEQEAESVNTENETVEAEENEETEGEENEGGEE